MQRHDPQEETLLAHWRDSGVSSLEDAAAWTVDRLRPDVERRILPIDFDALFKPTPAELAHTIEHGTLRSSIVVDNREVGNLTTFNGQPLHYIVDRSLLDGGPIRALTSLKELGDNLRELLRAEPPSGEHRLVRREDDGLIGYTQFCQFTDQAPVFEHAGYGGDVKWFGPPGFEWPNLSLVRRGWFGDWNDIISSIGNSRSHRWFVEHAGSGGTYGRSLYLAPGWEAFDLSRFADGWANDSISYIGIWPGPC
jgi:hypothetical protein